MFFCRYVLTHLKYNISSKADFVFLLTTHCLHFEAIQEAQRTCSDPNYSPWGYLTTRAPCFRCSFFSKFRGILSGFIIGGKYRSNSVPAFYGTLKFGFHRGFVWVLPLVKCINSNFIEFLSTWLKTKINFCKKVIRSFRCLLISKIFYRGLFLGNYWQITKTQNLTYCFMQQWPQNPSFT